jgi:hypothetical protein
VVLLLGSLAANCIWHFHAVRAARGIHRHLTPVVDGLWAARRGRNPKPIGLAITGRTADLPPVGRPRRDARLIKHEGLTQRRPFEPNLSWQSLLVVSVVGTTPMEPVLRAIVDDVGTDAAGLRSAIESRRVDAHVINHAPAKRYIWSIAVPNGRIHESKVRGCCAVKACMNHEPPVIPEALLLVLSAVIATLEAIRKAKGEELIAADFPELRHEVLKILTMFDLPSLAAPG